MPQHLTNRRGSLPAVGDTGMVYAPSMETKEIRVMSHEDAPGSCGERELRRIIGAEKF